MQIDVIVTFIFSVFFLTISPGPDILYVFIKSISEGKSEGVKLSFGLTSGLFFHTLLVVFGISAIINKNELYSDVIKYFGFLYFIFLFFLTLIKKNSEYQTRKSIRSSFFTGLMMNILNPKVSLFFIALFPGFIFHDSMKISLQFLVLGLIFWIIATLIFVTISLFSGSIKGYVDGFINNKFFKYLQSVIYLLIALYILI